MYKFFVVKDVNLNRPSIYFEYFDELSKSTFRAESIPQDAKLSTTKEIHIKTCTYYDFPCLEKSLYVLKTRFPLLKVCLHTNGEKINFQTVKFFCKYIDRLYLNIFSPDLKINREVNHATLDTQILEKAFLYIQDHYPSIEMIMISDLFVSKKITKKDLLEITNLCKKFNISKLFLRGCASNSSTEQTYESLEILTNTAVQKKRKTFSWCLNNIKIVLRFFSVCPMGS